MKFINATVLDEAEQKKKVCPRGQTSTTTTYWELRKARLVTSIHRGLLPQGKLPTFGVERNLKLGGHIRLRARRQDRSSPALYLQQKLQRQAILPAILQFTIASLLAFALGDEMTGTP